MGVKDGFLPRVETFEAGEPEDLRGKRVFITGITSPVGVEVADFLSGVCSSVAGLVRDRRRAENRVRNADLIEGICENPKSYREQLQTSAFIVHIAGMHLASWIVRACAGHTCLERILFISSARVLYPDRILSKKETSQKKALLEKETEVSSSLLPWTILRPTLIFSRGDRSLSRVTRYMTMKRYFPLPGPGSAVKQPISAKDLALSAVKALVSPAAYQKIYNVPGKEIGVREMLETISEELERRVTFIRIPRLPVAMLKRGLDTVGLDRRVGSLETFLRWYEDVRFSGDAASKDFGHRPRSFRENIREQITGLVR